MNKQTIITLFATALLLAGCGGGSGGSSGPSYSGPTGAVSVTNTTEANTVAGFTASWATSSLMSDVASGYATPAFGSTDATSLSLDLNSLGVLSSRVANLAFKSGIATTAQAAGVTGSETYDCATSGTYTLYGSVANASNPFTQAGDLYKITFNNCLAYDTLTTGSIQFVINSYTDSYNYSADYTFSSFKEVYTFAGSDYFMLHGGFSVALSDNGIDKVYSMTGSSLLMEGLTTSISPNVEQASYTNFSFVDTYYIGAGAFGADHDFTVASTALGGSLTVNTVTEFYMPSVGSAPTSGQLEITAGSATLTLTAQLNGTDVNVVYDYESDGTPEYDQIVAWTSL
jgi:hypothetical protein